MADDYGDGYDYGYDYGYDDDYDDDKVKIERIYAEDFLVHQNHLCHLHFPKPLS